MNIREASIKDISLIVDLWKEFMTYHDDIVRENPKLKEQLLMRKEAAENFWGFIEKNIKSDNSVVHIAEVDGEPAGYSLIYIKENIPVYKLESTGYLSDLFVRKKFRSLGISSALKDNAIKWFKNKGIKYLSIQVYSYNDKARSIYKKWGFYDFHVEMRREI